MPDIFDKVAEEQDIFSRVSDEPRRSYKPSIQALANPPWAVVEAAPEIWRNLPRFTGPLYESFGLPADPAQWPRDMAEGLRRIITSPIQTGTMILNAMGEGIEAQYSQVVDMLRQSRIVPKVQAIQHAVPLFGPMLTRAGEYLEAGQLPEAAGTMAGIVAQVAPFTMKPVPKPSAAPRGMPKSVQARVETVAGPLTAGEKASSGLIALAEPRVAQTAHAAAPAQAFLQRREVTLRPKFRIVGKKLGPPTRAIGESMAAERVALGSEIRNLAERSVAAGIEAKTVANDTLATAISGVKSAPTREFGETVMQAVRRVHNATDRMESVLHGAVARQADSLGFSAEWKLAKDFAAKIYRQAQAAKRMGKPTLPQDVIDLMGNVSDIPRTEALRSAMLKQLGFTLDDLNKLGGQFKSKILGEIEAAIQETRPIGSFTALKQARGGTRNLRTTLRKQGVFDNETLGALDSLYAAQTKDIRNALPTDLATAWDNAGQLTAQQKTTFQNKLLSDVMREYRPIKGEQLIQAIMREGAATDVAELLRVLPRETVSTLRRAATDWTLRHSGSADAALKFVSKRPQVKEILGDQYAPFVDSLMKRQAQELADAGYSRFLNRVAGTRNPTTVVRRIVNDPDYAANVAELSKGNNAVRQRITRDIYETMLDDATMNGPFWAPGSRVNPIDFAARWRGRGGLASVRDAVARFADPDAIAGIDAYTDILSRLKLSAQVPLPMKTGGATAATFETLYIIGAAGATVGSASVGWMLGSPFAGLVSGVAATTGVIMAPRVFIDLALSPKYSNLLARGLQIKTSAQETAWLSALGAAAVAVESGREQAVVKRSQQMSTAESQWLRDIQGGQRTMTQLMEAAKRGEVEPSAVRRIERARGQQHRRYIQSLPSGPP